MTSHNGKPLLSNGEKLYFSWRDMVDEESWMRLTKGSPFLKAKHFKNTTAFKRYFILSCGLLTGCVEVYGRERSGKSLFAYHLAMQLRDLFDKPCVFNRKPKLGFGAYETMPDEEFKAELDKLNQLVNDIEKLSINDNDEYPIDIQKRISELKFCGKSYVDDEAYKDVEKSRRTNRTRAYGQLVRQMWHLDILFMFISPDVKDFDVRMIHDRVTHRVQCRYERGWCNYNITVNTPYINGIVKSMELQPSKWSHLWNSHNLVGVSNFRIAT